MQKYNNKGTEILKTSRAEQPLTKLMPLERRPEKKPVGKTWTGNYDRNHGARSKQLETYPTKALQKWKNRTADPTKLKGETNEEKNAVGSEA